MICFSCLFMPPVWQSMHLYMLAYMFMHESCLLVCHPYFNTMKLWTFDPNLHLSLTDTTFCLLSYLFVFLLVCLFSCFFACHAYHAYQLYAFSTCSLHLFPSIACLLVSFFCLCMYTYGARPHGARAWSPKHKQKGRRCKHMDISQACGYVLFITPLPSSPISLLDGLY